MLSGVNEWNIWIRSICTASILSTTSLYGELTSFIVQQNTKSLSLLSLSNTELITLLISTSLVSTTECLKLGRSGDSLWTSWFDICKNIYSSRLNFVEAVAVRAIIGMPTVRLSTLPMFRNHSRKAFPSASFFPLKQTHKPPAVNLFQAIHNCQTIKLLSSVLYLGNPYNKQYGPRADSLMNRSSLTRAHSVCRLFLPSR